MRNGSSSWCKQHCFIKPSEPVRLSDTIKMACLTDHTSHVTGLAASGTIVSWLKSIVTMYMVPVGPAAHQGQENNDVCPGDYSVISAWKGDLSDLLNCQAEAGSLERGDLVASWVLAHQRASPTQEDVFTAYQLTITISMRKYLVWKVCSLETWNINKWKEGRRKEKERKKGRKEMQTVLVFNTVAIIMLTLDATS